MSISWQQLLLIVQNLPFTPEMGFNILKSYI